MKKVNEVVILYKALELAAADYYRGCKLVPDQEDGLKQGVLENWITEAKRLISESKDPK
jgi:methylphosphotriester-DNA--protein-cysteine methyltransferase